MKNGKKEISSKDGHIANGNAASDKPKLTKLISKMTVDELAENFTANELMKIAMEIRAKNRKKGIVIE